MTARNNASVIGATHASVLNPATSSQIFSSGSSLLQLQRQYGNRYVQRLLAMSRQSKDGATSSSEARARVEANKGDLGQRIYLKESLQTPGKPAKGLHSLVSQTSPLQVSRQGLLTRC